MLDYAANAVLYWPVETIRQRFEETCREQGSEPDLLVAEFIAGNAGAIADFWNVVETNLRAGKIRLVFAADEIPPELRRVVEFLNEQMNPAEVLAIEIRQYVGKDVRTLVPTVIGSSKRTTIVNGSPAKWDRESFVAALLERKDNEAVEIANRILDWAAQHLPLTWWGEGRRDGSCFLGLRHKGRDYYPFAIWTYGRVQLQLPPLRQRSVPTETLEELIARINLIPGIGISPDSLARYPAFDIGLLREAQTLMKFLSAFEWFIAQIKNDLAQENAPITTPPTLSGS